MIGNHEKKLRHGNVVSIKEQDQIEKVIIPEIDVEEIRSPPIPMEIITAHALRAIQVQSEEALRNIKSELTDAVIIYFKSQRDSFYHFAEKVIEYQTLEADLAVEKRAQNRANSNKEASKARISTHDNKNIHEENKLGTIKTKLGFFFGISFIILSTIFVTALVLELGMLDLIQKHPALAIASSTGAVLGALLIKYFFPVLLKTDKQKNIGFWILFFIGIIITIAWIFSFQMAHESIATPVSSSNEENVDTLHFMLYMAAQLSGEVIIGASILLLSDNDYLTYKKISVREGEEHYAHEYDYIKYYNKVMKSIKNISNIDHASEHKTFSEQHFVNKCFAEFESVLIKFKAAQYQSLVEKMLPDSTSLPQMRIVK